MKKSFIALSCALTAFFMASCGSTPAAEPLPEVSDVVEEVKEEVKEVVEEAADFSVANQALIALAETAREGALAADAKTYYPAEFEAADASLASLKNDVSANPATDYSVQIKDLAARYQSLASASQAQALKAKADSLSLGSEDQTSYDAGAKALEEYASMGASASGAELLVKANEALNAYNEVVNKGLKANAARERAAALEAKKLADSVKAGVAKKDDYTMASETFKKADSAYVTANIEGAFKGYKESKEVFNSLYEMIRDARAAAQAKIDAAKQRVADSESYAEDADSIAPLTEEVAGIEKEDAVLLEEDNLANPDDAVINVEEGITAKAAEKVAEIAIAAEEAVNDAVEGAVNEVTENSEAK